MSEPPELEYDLVVLGAGAGGMTAALVARLEGLRVLLVERAARVGGTTARSSGTVWIPDNPHQRAAGIDDRQAARTYLEALAAGKGDSALRAAFLAAGTGMVSYLERRAGIRFQPYWKYPDYRQDMPGAAMGGRALEPLPFDGRALGRHFDELAWPIPELMLFGGMMVTRPEAASFLEFSPKGFGLGLRLVARYAVDRLRYRRGTRLVLGNALAARLYAALLARGADIWLSTTASRLLRGKDGVDGLELQRGGETFRVRARRGIVLAGGGFPANAEWRARYLPKPTPSHTPAAPGCSGETIRLALDAGAALGDPGADNALWFPSSLAARADGSTAVYPHIVLDRAKPGMIAVDAAGRRFVDEAVSYHEFTRAMYRARAIPAWLLCDSRALCKYGMGMARPHGLNRGRLLRSGYLKCAPTIESLAAAIEVDGNGLRETVRRHNEFAGRGVDADFGKGSNAYDLANGDSANRPNPCLGPVVAPPFYAVALVPTPLGTALGLRTDASAQVCDAQGKPVGRLYACGNDMHSVMAGEYPGAGAQLGPAMTFGYVAALHAAQAERA